MPVGSRISSILTTVMISLLLTTVRGETLCAYNTENVVVIFMGGVRNTEVFEDSTHQYTPSIWQNIRPQGVMYTNFYNMAFTGMGTGTFEALMGVRRDENNRGTSWHGLSPGIFEYYRKERSVNQDKVWAVLSNAFDCYGVDYSLHPAYGAAYAGSIWGNDENDDIGTYEKTIQVMDQYKPSLLTVHFRDPDRRAQHTENPDLPDSIAWRNYTHAISVVDSLVNLIWTKINEDPEYADRTALFITSAHGRHSPLYGDFEWHGDACSGCRRLPFLAVGPDFKAGVTEEARGDLIDLCPTIGALLSFDPAFAEGRVLEELFLDQPVLKGHLEEQGFESRQHSHQAGGARLSRPGIRSKNPFVAKVRDVVHAVWTERDTSALLESWRVMYSKSQDEGSNWSEPTAIFATEDYEAEVITIASMTGDSSGIGVMTAAYTWDEYLMGDSTWVWTSDFKATLDGSEWYSQTNDYLRSAKLITVDNVPAVAIRDTLYAAVLLADRHQRYCAVSFDRGGDWLNFRADHAPVDEFTSPNTPSLALGDMLYYVETMRYVNRSKLFFYSLDGSGLELPMRTLIDETDDESFFPKLAWSDSVLYCVWSDDREGHWEVYFSRSRDGGDSWSTNQRLSDSGVNTWSTALEARHDTLLVVWEDYRDGAGSLYKKVSFDGGVHWSEDHAEVTTGGIATNPDLAYGGGRYYLVWQDHSNGDWEVLFKEVDIGVPVEAGGEEPGAGRMPVSMFLHQNYPNPFNPRTEIGFEVPGPVAVEVELVIYDLRGRLVKVLVDGMREPGRHTVVWDGTDRCGREVASGAYFYNLAVTGGRMTRKMLLAK